MDLWTLFTNLLIAAPLLYIIFKLYTRQQADATEVAELKAAYGPVDAARKKLTDAKSELKSVQLELARLQKDVLPLLGEEALLASGFYRIAYSFPDAEGYKAELERIREEQKQMVKAGTAVLFDTTWTVNDNEKAGQKFAKDISAMMLRAFNGECDATVARVSYKNYGTSLARIQKAYEQLNKLGRTLNCQLYSYYLTLKERELKVAFEYAEMKYEEAEEQRAIRERLREEERAERELRKAVEDAEDEERRWNKALKLAQAKLATSSGAAQAELAAQVASLQEQLSSALAAKQRALSMAQKTRAGYVYVISNIGAFGEDVYKVGLTRRLDPLDRVRELSGASVPFEFDVHALIYSEDAPALETALHRELAQFQVNRVNDRKEFFRADLGAIERAVNKHHGRFSLTRVAEAKQFRESLALGGDGPVRNALPATARPGTFKPTSFGRVPAAE